MQQIALLHALECAIHALERVTGVVLVVLDVLVVEELVQVIALVDVIGCVL
jgi:hypothetical protein